MGWFKDGEPRAANTKANSVNTLDNCEISTLNVSGLWATVMLVSSSL